MMADAGNPQGALDLGHANLRNADSPDLRLTLAQIHLGAGIQIAEADAVLKPLSSAGGRVAAEARALRQEVQNHPELENERYRSLLTVEEKLGIGQRKPVRCRVLFPSDRYALAEMPNVRAPSFYQHRTLRVMVTPSALPDGVTIDGLKKGVEFTAQVVGEDDHKGDRVRVYWIADNTQIEIIASPKDRGTKERERPAAKSASKERGKAPANSSDEGDREGQPAIDADPALELAYNIGTEKAVLIRIERVHRRGGLLLGRALPPGNPDGEAFPVRVGIHRKFVPEERRDQRWKGSHVLCQIERTNRNGKLCYDGVSMLTMAALETEPSSPAPENHDTEQAELASTEGDAAAPATRDESKAPASSEEPTEQSTASTGNTSSQADAAPTEQTKEEADATEPIADDKNADDKNADDKNADDKNADDKNADDKNADDKNADDKNADDKNVTAQTEEEEACDD
jgi:hypothetical protein